MPAVCWVVIVGCVVIDVWVLCRRRGGFWVLSGAAGCFDCLCLGVVLGLRVWSCRGFRVCGFWVYLVLISVWGIGIVVGWVIASLVWRGNVI